MTYLTLSFLALLSFSVWGQRSGDDEKKLVFMVSSSLGLVHNVGTSGTVICVDENDRMRWFAETDISFLSADRIKLGRIPDDLALGAGIYPFKKPTVAVALKARKSMFSDKVGVGPELSINKFIGRNKNFYVVGKIGTAYYAGEPNPEGKNHTLISEARIGVGVRVFTKKNKK